MKTKILGGILLIVGTSIGGGMLGLPVATAPGGLLSAIALLFLYWIVTTFCAFLMLEVNLSLPPNSNLISMAKLTLGWPGQMVTWLVYLFLLYCLLAAYIAGGADIFHHLWALCGINSLPRVDALLVALLLGLVVYKGIQSVDIVNRGLMLSKIIVYLALVAGVLPFMTQVHWLEGEWRLAHTGVMMVIVSFGFAIIIPSLRVYYHDDIQSLKKTIWIGTSIPLFCYILWEVAILGTLPRLGDSGLLNMLNSGHAASGLPQALSLYVHNHTITVLARFFTSICVATSFLGVALSLSDFLADGLKLNKVGLNQLWIYLATFLPPLLLVLFKPDIFIQGLDYGGICCVILLMLLPALMALASRYKKIATPYRSPGGIIALLAIIIISLCSIVFGF